MADGSSCLEANEHVHPPAFLTEETWSYVVQELALSRQQARIVSLILQGKQDKETARELGLKRDTIKTYLKRVFDRLGVEDRLTLVLRIFALCVERDARARSLDAYQGVTFRGGL